MSDISGVTAVALDSQLAGIQLRQQINYKIAAKTLDATRRQGDAIVSLLDQAVEISRNEISSSQPSLTMASLVSGLGQNLDISA